MKPGVKTLEESIMESADWSGSRQIQVKCTQGDLESALLPILRSLIKLRRNKSVNEAREQLAKFINADREFEERVYKVNVSKAAIALERIAVGTGPGKNSDAVYKFLKENLEPIAIVLEGVHSPRVRRLGKKLRKTYENRYSPPTKEEAAAYRLRMLQMGQIPYKKMTRPEKAEYNRQMASQRLERNQQRREAERVLGIRRPSW